MKRREFLKSSSAAAAAGTAAVTAATTFPMPLRAAAKKRFRWRLVMVVPKTLGVWADSVVEMAKNIKEMTSGGLDIKVYGAGELVPALGTFDAVRTGKVQMGHSASYYWHGQVPATVFFTAIPFGMNAACMRAWLQGDEGQALWDELYKPHNVVSFPAGNPGLQMGGWFNKEIKSIKDFKGLKMRIPGLGGKVLAKAGGKPILMPGGEIFTNLSTGVIDAAEWISPFQDYVMGFYKAAKYYYFPGWHEPNGTLELMVNRTAFEKLPKEYQAVVRAAAAQCDRNMFAAWQAKDAEYLAKIKKEAKVQIKEFPQEVIDQLRTYAMEVQKEIAGTSPLAKKISDSYNSFQDTFFDYLAVSEYPYLKMKISKGSS